MPSFESLPRLELKYCELCGGLWLRRAGAPLVYCPACRPRMASLPPPRALRPGAKRDNESALPPTAAAPALANLVLVLLNTGLTTAGWGCP